MISDDPTVIAPTLEAMKKSFSTQKTKSIAYRKTQLKALLEGLKALDQEFHVALEKDLGVTQFGSQLTSTIITRIDVEHNLSHLESWAKPKYVDTPFVIGPGNSKIVYEPLGVVLVIAAWNYPLYTAIPPMAAAIAAGNCVILKPSEMSPHSSNVLKKLVTTYLDQDCFRVIEGAIQVASQICSFPFDLIIFTGSPEKGKLVARAASENLVPCILELGGKSPTIVDKDVNLEMAAQRVVQGRYVNAGQTCVACDYLLVHQDIVDKFAQALKRELINFYGQDASKSADYPRIVTVEHTQRLVSLLDENDHKGTVVCGGQYDVPHKYVAPTIVINPRLDSKIMTQEIFGPILPILPYKDFKEAVKFINDRPKPLALYYFGNDSQHKQYLQDNTSSGALVHNDAVFHLLNPNLPFGGVGNSGYSAYHGISGFRSCSHQKPVYDKSTINFYPFNVRYPPFTPSKQRILTLFFKFSSVSQRAVQNGVILIALILGLGYSHKHGHLLKLRDKAKPYLRDLYRHAGL